MLIQREQENQKLEEQYAARLYAPHSFFFPFFFCFLKNNSKQRADEEPRVRVLQEKSASLLETVNQLNKEQQSKSSQYKNLKDQETMLKEQIVCRQSLFFCFCFCFCCFKPMATCRTMQTSTSPKSRPRALTSSPRSSKTPKSSK